MSSSRWFRGGSYGLIALAALHFFSNRHGLPVEAYDKAGRKLVRLMSSYEIDFFGVHRTLDATIDGFIVTWGAMLLAIATVNLCASALGRDGKPPASLRWANLAVWTLCFLASLAFWSWPQILSFGAIAAAFALSLKVPAASPSAGAGAAERPDPRVAIIGAGAAGLTAAWALKKNGYRNVTVFEKSDRVGGKCMTFEFENHAIDLAAHEMLAGYTDVMRIADDVGASSHGWQNVEVYDRDERKFLDIMTASTLGGYSKLQVGCAALRYTWLLLTRYRRFAQPGTGLADTPVELLQPVGSWLRATKLDALQLIVTFVMKVQGYGRLDEAPAAYFVKFQGLRNWVSNVLHNVGIMHGWPRVFTHGFEDLWQRVAMRTDVRLNAEIESVRRTMCRDREAIDVEITVKGEAPQHFDSVIVACPLDRPTLEGLGLDMSPDEARLFGKVKYHTFVTTACRVEGLPAGVIGSIPLPPILDYTGYIKVYPEVDVVVFFSLAPGPDVDLHEVYQRICETVATLPETEGKPPRVIECLRQKAWPYFPHPGSTDMAAGFFKEVNALQGYRQTFYAGSLLEMETVGNTVANTLRRVTEQFPPRS